MRTTLTKTHNAFGHGVRIMHRSIAGIRTEA